jgi:hypothetical protein
VDLDEDGKGDLLSGSYSPGKLFVFRGLGGGKFAEGEVLKGADGEPLIPGHAATVHAVDWDGDGDLDLICGNIRGGVVWFANQGSDAEPKYGPKTPVEAGGKPLRVGGDSGPVTADWDGDGTLDLLVGSGDGSVVFCRGVAAGKGKAPKLEAPVTIIPKTERNQPGGIGIRSKVCPVDWNGDGKLDLLAGTYGREIVAKKKDDEESKARLAEAIKTRDEAMKEYRKVFDEICAKVLEKDGRAPGARPNKEEWAKVRQYIENGGELVDRYLKARKEMGDAMTKINRLRGVPKTLGHVWLFTRS